jgi:hypothetical protein
MADSVHWITSCVGNSFIEAWATNEQEVSQCGLDSSPTARAILSMFGGDRTAWEGTMMELLELVNQSVGYAERGRDYPTDAKMMGKRLKRDQPLLVQAGLRILSTRTANKRMVKIERA